MKTREKITPSARLRTIFLTTWRKNSRSLMGTCADMMCWSINTI